MQLVRLLVMIVAVAAVIYALEYLPATPMMWVSVGVLLFGFLVMLFAFRTAQRQHGERRGAAPAPKKRRRS